MCQCPLSGYPHFYTHEKTNNTRYLSVSMPSVGQSLFLPCPLGTGCLSHFPASFLHVFFWIIRFSHTIRSKIGQVVNCFYFSHNLRSSIFSIITHEPKQSTAQFYLPGAKTMPIDLPPSAVQVVFYFDLKTSLPTYNHGQSLRFAWFVLPYTKHSKIIFSFHSIAKSQPQLFKA